MFLLSRVMYMWLLGRERIPNRMGALRVDLVWENTFLGNLWAWESKAMFLSLSLSFLLVISTNSVSCWSMWITTIDEWRRQSLSIHLVCRVMYGFIWANCDSLSLLKVEVIKDRVSFQSIVSKTTYEGIMVLMREQLECSNPWTPQ
jgi:hypothetical protein